MRLARYLLPILAAIAVAGCARQQQAYYIIDPQTGQPIPVVTQQQQPYGQPQYAQQAYEPQPAYRQPAAQPQYVQPQYAQAQVAQPQYAQPHYAQAPAAPKQAATSRGLFSRSPAYAQQSYAPQPFYQQPASQPSYQPAPQPSYQPAPQPSYQQPAAQTSPARSGNRGFFTSRSRAPSYQAQPQYAQQPRYSAGGPYVAAPATAYAAAPATQQPAYTLDAGDKLRVVVFGQEGITNSYMVGADGSVNLPLVGSVPARGFTTQQLSTMISERLKQGYVREPHVSVEVESYRPFFILGEVTTPGQYPYVANMTAETAIAIAGGFSARANKRNVELTRSAPGQQMKGDVPLNYPLRPGDTIVVKERWF